MGVSVMGIVIPENGCKQIDNENLLPVQLDKTVYLSNMNTLEAHLNMYLKQFDILIVVTRLEIIRKYLSGILFTTFVEPLVTKESIIDYLEQLESYKYDLKLPQSCSIFSRDRKQFPILRLHRLFVIPQDITTEESLSGFSQYIKNLNTPQFTKLYTLLCEKPVEEFLQCEKFPGMNVEKRDNSLYLKISGEQLGMKPLIQFQQMLYDKLGSYILKSELIFQNELFESVSTHVIEAIDHIGQCFATYGPKNVFLSFNGGKDCTVLLHMMLAVLKKNYPEFTDSVLCMYVKHKNPFPEVDDFIDDMKEYYNLEIVSITYDIKEALQKVLSDRPNLKACLMGTRRMDPFSQDLNHFQMTDASWPQIMRVSPLLDWEYAEIWDYIVDFKVPYCSLYDHGYTSLGNVDNTVPNPALLHYDEVKKCDTHLPASKLYDGSKERLGRCRS